MKDLRLTPCPTEGTRASQLLDDAATRSAVLRHLRAVLDADFLTAQSWPELQGRLMGKGFSLRQGTKGLELLHFPTAEHLATLAEFGVSDAALEQRCGGRFPQRPRDRDTSVAPPTLHRPASSSTVCTLHPKR